MARERARNLLNKIGVGSSKKNSAVEMRETTPSTFGGQLSNILTEKTTKKARTENILKFYEANNVEADATKRGAFSTALSEYNSKVSKSDVFKAILGLPLKERVVALYELNRTHPSHAYTAWSGLFFPKLPKDITWKHKIADAFDAARRELEYAAVQQHFAGREVREGLSAYGAKLNSYKFDNLAELLVLAKDNAPDNSFAHLLKLITQALEVSVRSAMYESGVGKIPLAVSAKSPYPEVRAIAGQLDKIVSKCEVEIMSQLKSFRGTNQGEDVVRLSNLFHLLELRTKICAVTPERGLTPGMTAAVATFLDKVFKSECTAQEKTKWLFELSKNDMLSKDLKGSLEYNLSYKWKPGHLLVVDKNMDAKLFKELCDDNSTGWHSVAHSKGSVEMQTFIQETLASNKLYKPSSGERNMVEKEAQASPTLTMHNNGAH
jgi:hypothetical protein